MNGSGSTGKHPGNLGGMGSQGDGAAQFTHYEWTAGGHIAAVWGLRAQDRAFGGAAMASAYYEIRVSGTLPSEVLLDFERLTADVAPVETVLHGSLPGQSALAALLARLEEFGADVLEIRRLRESDPASGR
jgi:hypothetical protein